MSDSRKDSSHEMERLALYFFSQILTWQGLDDCDLGNVATSSVKSIDILVCCDAILINEG
jgi:hypothetical protein